jgi:hypothetical protein
MRRHDAALIAARFIGRRSSVRTLLTALVLMLALGGCYESHGRITETRPIVQADAWVDENDGGRPFVTDAATVPIDAGCHVDLDHDGVDACADCNDGDATIHPGATEWECGLDGEDSNCDGWDYDRECEMDPGCLEWLCNG